MELIVAYKHDVAGYNMAKFISQNLTMTNGVYKGKFFDVMIIDSPTIYA
ncbi:MAG: hypothetical protein OXF77_01090 [Thaumarchaeota archaeon]|nr:hypothetical protein [Nitrososphaerota archaeon]